MLIDIVLHTDEQDDQPFDKHANECTQYTVFPQSLTAVRFYFKALFDAVTIRGWLDFKGSIDTHVHT